MEICSKSNSFFLFYKYETSDLDYFVKRLNERLKFKLDNNFSEEFKKPQILLVKSTKDRRDISQRKFMKIIISKENFITDYNNCLYSNYDPNLVSKNLVKLVDSRFEICPDPVKPLDTEVKNYLQDLVDFEDTIENINEIRFSPKREFFEKFEEFEELNFFKEKDFSNIENKINILQNFNSSINNERDYNKTHGNNNMETCFDEISRKMNIFKNSNYYKNNKNYPQNYYNSENLNNYKPVYISVSNNFNYNLKKNFINTNNLEDNPFINKGLGETKNTCLNNLDWTKSYLNSQVDIRLENVKSEATLVKDEILFAIKNITDLIDSKKIIFYKIYSESNLDIKKSIEIIKRNIKTNKKILFDLKVIFIYLLIIL